MDSASESLLAQILLIVQDVQVSLESFEKRLDEAKESIDSLNKRIDDVIAAGFPRGDLKGHRLWHEERDLPMWKRTLLKMIVG